MSEDRPLTEFSSTDSTDGRVDEGDTGNADADEPDTEDAESIEPATVTYRWRSEGAVCAQCGASTEKQWLDDGEFVCPNCKRWE